MALYLYKGISDNAYRGGQRLFYSLKRISKFISQGGKVYVKN